MKQLNWLHWILAAAIVVACGVVLAFAGDDPELRKMVKVNVNGDIESLELDDLADGETREFDAGEHAVTVTRRGDELFVSLDGEEIGGPGPGSDPLVWVTKDEFIESGGEGGARRVVIVKRDCEGDCEGEGEFRTITVHADCDDEIEDCEEIDIDIESVDELIAGAQVHKMHVTGHPHTVFMTSEDGHHPMIIKSGMAHAGMVRYRCEESGSELLLKEEDAVADTYLCPATGCVMEKVTEPEVKVIKVMRRVEPDEDPNE